ncbi:MAG: HPr family phosphocarrier protein [bacterium]|nr:HPr family phosphocarrier protein [bacterium]
MEHAPELIRDITVVNRLGLHARPSAMLVQLANQFKSDLYVSRDGEDEVNAKSIMGVMMLAAARGTVLRFRAVGDDAKPLLDALEQLFLSKFNED